LLKNGVVHKTGANTSADIAWFAGTTGGRWLVVSLSFFLTSCYSFIGRYQLATTGQHPYSVGARNYWYVDIAKRNIDRREDYTRELFSSKPAMAGLLMPKTALSPLQRKGQPRDVSVQDASEGTLVFRVGLLSDVHIRQSSTKLFNDQASRELRYVVDSFERNGYQEAFGSAVLAATISAFNQLDSVDAKPRLVMNGGDAIDAGTIEEAYDYASAAHYLRYPCLYALGNHDSAIFGNYEHRLGYTKDAGPSFYPIGDRNRFLLTFNNLRNVSGFSDHLIPIPDDYPSAQLNARWALLDVLRENDPGVEDEMGMMKNTCPEGACRQATFCSGFDLNGPAPTKASRCETRAGYYAVVVPGTDGSKVQLVVLKTAREDGWGADPEFDDKERDWLAAELKVPADLTIVLMHHRPDAIKELDTMLSAAGASRPLVVLSGHSHGHDTKWHDHYWEFNTGSLVEFPQWSRIVEIRRGANGRYYVNARTLRPRLSIFVSPPDLTAYGVPRSLSPEDWDSLPRGTLRGLEPWFESQFAACDKVAALPAKDECAVCSQAFGGKSLLHDSAQCGYLGALYDHLLVPYAVLHKTSLQAGAAARQVANVVLDISP
jgi:predicted MPP superfamily phosphohydrolase